MIRNFTNTDLEAVMDLWLTTNIQAHDFIRSDYWKENFRKVSEMLPQAEIYVCEHERRIVGFIGLSGNYIAGLFINKDSQGQGIGKKLLDHVKGGRDIITLQVYEKNGRAIRFYEREGFHIVKEHDEEETGEKEFLMEWRSEDGI